MQISTITKILPEKGALAYKKCSDKIKQLNVQDNKKIASEFNEIVRQRQLEIESKIKSIKSMEDALRISGYFDRVNFVPNQSVFIPKAKSPAEQIINYTQNIR